MFKMFSFYSLASHYSASKMFFISKHYVIFKDLKGGVCVCVCMCVLYIHLQTHFSPFREARSVSVTKVLEKCKLGSTEKEAKRSNINFSRKYHLN